MKLTIISVISTLFVLCAAGTAAAQNRHACSVSCGGGTPGKTCGDYRVSQQQCFNKCMGYEACPGVGFPKGGKDGKDNKNKNNK